jgi:hypothetical protein
MHIERSTGKILPFVKSKNDRCSICGKIVGHEEAQTDERGDVVHEPCLVARSSSPAGRKNSGGPDTSVPDSQKSLSK